MAKRGDKRRHPKKAAFLAAFRESGNVTVAAEAARITRQTHYKWLAEDAAYAEEFADANDQAVDRLEEEARRRAIEGVEEPVGWYQGSAGGTVRKYSDTLLIFLLKGARPDRYRERHEHTGKDGGPIETRGTVNVYLPDNGRAG